MSRNYEFDHQLLSGSPEETQLLGRKFAELLPSNAIIALFGELGSGKTTFVKGLVEGITGICTREVCSPTFTYLNVFEGKITVYHFDLYRLKEDREFLFMGFNEYFYAGGICCIEWPERIAPLLPENTFKIRFFHAGSQRTIFFDQENLL